MSVQDEIKKAIATERQYLSGAGISALNKAIRIWERLLNHSEYADTSCSFQAKILNDSASAYLRRYWETGGIYDLETAVSFWEEAVLKTPEDSPVYSDRINNLGNGLKERYFSFGNYDDLQKAVKAYRKAVSSAREKTPNLPLYMNNLGNGLRNLYSISGNVEYLVEGIEAYEKAISMTAEHSPDFPMFVNNLGNGLRDRFHHLGNSDDLEAAVKAYRKAVSMTPEDSPHFPQRLSNLSVGLTDRYCLSGVLSDLEAAIDASRKAISLTADKATELPDRLANLGSSLRIRHDVMGNPADLKEGIDAFRKAAALAPEHSPKWPSYLVHLGTGLADSFHYYGSFSDLEEGIDTYRKAIAMTLEDALELPHYLNCLGTALLYKYGRSGNPHDIEEAIHMYEKAVSLASESSPDFPVYVNNLGAGRTDRYYRLGCLDDLEKGIAAYRKAVSMSSEDSPDFPMCLNNLGVGLRERFFRLSHFADLEEGVALFRKSICLLPGNSPKLPMYLNNLGNGLTDRFAVLKKTPDLEEGIDAYRKAVALLPADSPHLPTCLGNLGSGLSDRYDALGYLPDLEESIDAHRKAVAMSMENPPYLLRHLNNLGDGLIKRHRVKGEPDDLETGVEALRKAAEMGLDVALEESLRSSKNWLKSAFDRGAWEEANLAYSYAYRAVEKLLKAHPARDGKEIWLREIQGFASIAAYALARLNKLQNAVTEIEKGQAQLLSEALSIERVNLKLLERTENAEQVDAYRKAANRWHALSRKEMLSEQELADLTLARTDLDNSIQAIRKIEGFENFLAFPSFSEIQTVSKDTYLIYILSTNTGGLALVLKENVRPIWLPQLQLKEFSQMLMNYLGAYLIRHEYEHVWRTTLEDLTHRLWDAVMEPVVCALPAGAKTTLIVSGPLVFFPLHAAWEYDSASPTGKRYAMDTLNISFAPNARALGQAIDLVSRTNTEKILAVDDPRGDLPHSEYEVQSTVLNFQDFQILRRGQATCKFVLSALESCDLFHFSCHGKADFENPLFSALFMADGEIRLRDFFNLRWKGMRLAVLSACETGIPDINLPDESVNLPSGLLQAGVAGVISTLWPVGGMSTMMLMIRFYHTWIRESLAPCDALRSAEIWMRDSTNREKLAYFRELEKRGQFPNSAMKSLYREIGFSNPEARDFAHPHHWAAFQYVGA